MELGDRKGYWDLLGKAVRGGGALKPWDVAQRQEGLTAAVGAVILLIWTMDGMPLKHQALSTMGEEHTEIDSSGRAAPESLTGEVRR